VQEGSPGFIPTDGERRTTHPDYADYKQRRPEQTLSHFSSVMLYHANKAKTNPTEVQYGYLHDKNNNLKLLYSSANSYKGQQWLKENSTAASIGGEAAAAGAEAGATGAEVGATSAEVGSEVGEVGGEIGGEGSSAARSVGDLAKQTYKGAKKANDINNDINGNNNSSDGNDKDRVGINPLLSAIDSMGGGSSLGASDSLFSNPKSEGTNSLGTFPHQEHENGIATEDPIAKPEEDSVYLTDIDPTRGSGNMRI